MLPPAMTTLPQLESATTELDALLHGAAIAPLGDLGWLRVTGEDRVRWLNGMVTNSITDLETGQGCYTFILSAQGRIQGTAYAYAEQDSILLQTDVAQLQQLSSTLDRFIIMDDVELADTSSEWSGISLLGPLAKSLIAAIGLAPGEADPLTMSHLPWHFAPVTVIHAHSPLVPRFELWSTPDTIAALADALLQAGAHSCSPEALEHLRILEGTPRYGTDIRNSETARELPQETAQTRALHFAKGCYLGQEIVERIRSRGNVHRTFTGFRLEGTLPAPGTSIEADGKVVGELTSVAAVPIRGETIQVALGYIRREALDRAAILSYPGGQATPVTLPFPVL